MDTYTYGTTPEDTIRAALPHKYDMSLTREDMLTVLDALLVASEMMECHMDRAWSLRSSILETIGIEEI
jgi:hypothetical protein